MWVHLGNPICQLGTISRFNGPFVFDQSIPIALISDFRKPYTQLSRLDSLLNPSAQLLTFLVVTGLNPFTISRRIHMITYYTEQSAEIGILLRSYSIRCITNTPLEPANYPFKGASSSRG